MPASSTSAAPIPERVGRYEILLPIASGGMATVYLARSRGGGGFERDVALKLTHAHLRDTDDFANDLLEEAKLVVRIRHPNVVPVLDADDDPLGVFLAMEYVEGDSLGGLRRRADKAGGRVPARVGARVLVDALAGLHAAHELKGDDGHPLELVHRDFSPQNILVGTDGVAKLTDFGIAKAASRLGTTRAGLVKGKITYMAPEQARSLALDRRCDVWAAGIIAWEMFAGRRLYAADNEVGTLLKIVSDPPPLLRAVAPEVPQEIEEAVAHALTLNLEQRVRSAQAFARELTAACAPTGGLAEHEEVAAYLQSAVGARLEKRRARAAEIIRLRSQMASIRKGAPQPPDSASSLLDDQESSQSGPILAVPPSMTAAAKLSVASAPPPMPQDLLADVPRNDDDVPTVAPPATDPTIPIATPIADEASPPSLAPEPTVPDALAPDVTSGPVPLSLPAPAAPLVRDRRLLALAGAVALALVLGLAAVATHARATAANTSADTSADTSAAASGSVAVAPAALAASASVAPTASPLELADDAPALPRRSEVLAVTANAPIAHLKVDDRVVPIDRDARSIDLELTSAERARVLKLHAQTADGRETTTTVAAGVGAAELAFPKPAAPARAAAKRPSLAASPYGK